MNPLIRAKHRTTDLFRKPSFMKGMSRVVDLEGKLDAYKYKDNPDTEALERDWIIVGETIYSNIEEYDKKQLTG